MSTLVLVRHGQSLWNQQNRFTGWVDVPLTEKGQAEARRAGELLAGRQFDVAYTSVLQRAIQTCDLLMQAGGISAPIVRDQALNERHYGDLQGLDKAETAAKYGDEQVHIWRRSFDVPPPNGESLKDTAARTLPFFSRSIMGDLTHGRDVLVVAHGNSNRSIVMELDGLSQQEVLELNLATGVPLVYEIAADGSVTDKTILEH